MKMRSWVLAAVLLTGLALALQPQTQQMLGEAQSLAQQARQNKVAPSPDLTPWKQAIAKAEEATKAEPSAPETWGVLAQLYTETKFWSKAEEAWNQYIQLKGLGALGDAQVAQQAATVQVNLGYIAYVRSDYDLATDKFSNAIELNPKDSQPYQWLGRIYLEQGNATTAREYWQRAEALKPDAANRYFLNLSQDSTRYGTPAVHSFSLGYDAYTSGQKEAALQAFSTATQAAPGWLEAKRWVGRTQLELGQGQAAFATWQQIGQSPQATASDRYQLRVAELSSQFGMVAAQSYLQGVVQFQAGSRGQARESFKQAVVASPNFAAAWYWLGRSAYEGKDYAAAAEAYQQVLRLEPGNKEAAYWLAQTRKANQ